MLDMDVAIELAEVLTDIPNKSRMAGAMKEAVRKLQKWCVGGDFAGRNWTPEDQARWLVDEACAKWNTWNGYGALYAIFLTRFPPPRENTYVKVKPAISLDDAREYIQRLLGSPNFPSNRQGIEALERCLIESSLSAAIAERVISECQHRSYCPNLSDLKTACEYAALNVDLTSLFDDLLAESSRSASASIEESN